MPLCSGCLRIRYSQIGYKANSMNDSQVTALAKPRKTLCGMYAAQGFLFGGQHFEKLSLLF